MHRVYSLLNPAQLHKSLASLYPTTGKASVKWCATISHHFQMNCFRSVIYAGGLSDSSAGLGGPRPLLPVSQQFWKRVILRVQITCITGRGEDEVNFSGTSICKTVSRISEMLLSQLQTLFGMANKEQKTSQRGMAVGGSLWPAGQAGLLSSVQWR